MSKESIMGVKTAKKTITKKKALKKKFPPLSSRVERLDEAMASMAAAVSEMAASEAMLTEKIAAVAETVKETSRELRQTTKNVDNLSETVKETSRELRQTTQNVDNLSEMVKETSRELRQTTKDLNESVEKTTREMRQTTKDLNESVEKTTREMRQTTKDLAESVDKLNKNVGGINNSIGKVVELVLLPGLMDKMNSQFGYPFDNISPNKIFTESGNQYAEVDLFLENGEAVMAVEAKTRVKESGMNEFLMSLNELRQHENKAGVAGKTIYAAVAGISFDDKARKLATANGMYLVELNHSNALVTIEPPAGAVGKW
jgi:DNA repair exonuclease SbcCD ATPase subunit